jgi:hypothetical protein
MGAGGCVCDEHQMDELMQVAVVAVNRVSYESYKDNQSNRFSLIKKHQGYRKHIGFLLCAFLLY